MSQLSLPTATRRNAEKRPLPLSFMEDDPQSMLILSFVPSASLPGAVFSPASHPGQARSLLLSPTHPSACLKSDFCSSTLLVFHRKTLIPSHHKEQFISVPPQAFWRQAKAPGPVSWGHISSYPEPSGLFRTLQECASLLTSPGTSLHYSNFQH